MIQRKHVPTNISRNDCKLVCITRQDTVADQDFPDGGGEEGAPTWERPAIILAISPKIA